MSIGGYVMLALIAMSAVAYADVSPVVINPSPVNQVFRVEEGFVRTFEFSLDEPIICPQQANKECNVVILLTNSHPNELALDNCHVKWRWDQWTESRFITVRAVEDFVDDGEKTFTIVTEPIQSISEYYNGYNVADITLRTAPRPSAVCRATGDPHYTTFDGHRYHVYAPGRLIFYKSLVRNFEVQTDMYSFARPAVHCAVAARENNDVVVISLCHDGHSISYRRSCGSNECLRGGYPRVGISGSSNPTYVIDFASGSRVTAQVAYWRTIGRKYINMYVTAPGVDRGNTAGMCGNNDGNSGNDVNAGYNSWIYSFDRLYDSQLPTYDLFSWYPTGISDETFQLPPFAEECDYTDPPFIRPILNNPDIEDITELLRDVGDPEIEGFEGIEFDGTVIENLPEEWTREESEAACETIRGHNVAVTCLEVFPEFDLDGFIAQCVEDLIETGGDPDFLEIAIDALEDECGDEGNRDLDTWETDENEDPMEPNLMLQNTLCPNECSGHGTCVRTRCVCEEGFVGVDCSLNIGAPATLESVEPSRCDTRGVLGCSREVSVYGTNLWNTNDLACRFGDVVSEARQISFNEVRCVVPDVEQSGAQVIVSRVEVTTDGENWIGADDVTFTWYDAICQVCDDSGCEANPTSCNIDGECYIEGQHTADNICRTCQPSVSVDAWVYDYSNGIECGPEFDATIYTAEIVAEGHQGDVLTTVNAVNPLVAEDPENSISFAFAHDEHIFAIDNSGVITLAQDIVVTEQMLHNMEFTNLVHIIATDAAGNTAESTLYVTILLTNSVPLFEETLYTFEIEETTEVGSVIGTITASDADGDSSEWGVVTYSWAQVESGEGDVFVVDPSTGEISIGQALDFERKDTYTLKLSARDGGGQSHLTDVLITIVDVNEAPTAISLSSTSIAENSEAGTIVGTISVDDQDADDTHSVRIDPASNDFAIAGSELRAARSFDYENPADQSLSVTLVATDAAGNEFSETFDIEVTNVNEPPTNVRLVDVEDAHIMLPENVEVNRIIADVAVDDIDSDMVGCTLTNTDSSHFIMENNRIVLVSALDFEADSEHMVTVVCADDAGAQSEPLDVTISITDVEEGPSNINFVLASNGPVPENTAVGTPVGVVVAEDADEGSTAITFEITSDDARVELGEPDCDDSTGTLICSAQVTISQPLDYESTNGQYRFVVRASDAGDMFNEEELVIPVSDSNDAASGVVWAQGGEVTADAPEGTVVGTLFVVNEDADQSFVVTLDSTAFAIQESRRRSVDTQGNTAFGATVVVSDSSSFSVGEPVALSVSVTDTSDNPITSTFEINVDVVAPNLNVILDNGLHVKTVQENTAVGTVVASLVVTGVPEGKTAVLSLTPRQHVVTPFELSGNDIVVSGPIDYEAFQGYVLDVNVDVPETDLSLSNVRFTIVIGDIDEPVEFVETTEQIFINTDLAGGTLFEFVARDPERHAVTLSIVSDETDGIVALQNNKLVLAGLPSARGINPDDYVIVIAATVEGADPVTQSVTLTFHDDCFNSPCGDSGRCVDAFRTFTCICADGFSGQLCDISSTPSISTTQGRGRPGNRPGGRPVVSTTEADTGVDLQASSSNVSQSGIAGIVVGVIALLVLIALLAFLVMRRSQNERLETLYGDVETYKAMHNPTFAGNSNEVLYEMTDGMDEGSLSNPMYDTYTSDFTPGVANPLYAWYQPDYTREQSTDELRSAPTGAFVVRDSASTQGWLMLGVRTEQDVIHEKIRHTPAGYQLMASNCSQQPVFPDVPTLVGYYSTVDSDVGFKLVVSSLSNPMYGLHSDNSMWTRDEQAPMVPLKEREMEAVRHLADMSDDMYLNTAEAKTALSSST